MHYSSLGEKLIIRSVWRIEVLLFTNGYPRLDMMLYIVEQFDRLDNNPREDFVRHLFSVLYREKEYKFRRIKRNDDVQGYL